MTITKNLPAALRENGLFCCWRYEERNGKRTKVPYNPRTGGRAKSTDPATFTSLAAAEAAQSQYDGLGVGIFSPLGAIDIDHCISEAGELSDMAAEIVEIMDAYTESSPSGHGLRILFTVPGGFTYDKDRYYINNQRLGLEVYISGATKKYVTVTGDAYTPGKDLEDRGGQLLTVLEKFMVRQTPTHEDTPAASSVAGGPPPVLDDLAIINRAKSARNGAKFAALMDGDTTGYKSRSEADIAFCNMLAFWTDRDAAMMDRIFRASGLMRDKWDRPQSGSTYGAITIQNAIRTVKQRPNSGPPNRHGSAAEVSESVRPPDYSDAGNASVFSRVYKNDLIFVDALGWLWWNGKRWERNDHKALAWALDLSERMLREARTENRDALLRHAEAQAKHSETGEDADGEAVKVAEEAKKKAKAYLTHAQNLRGATRLKNMMELSKPDMHHRADELDADPMALNTPAGIVNLANGEIRPHERRAYCSQITAVSPGERGRERWLAFLQTVTCGDGGVQGFLQLVAGMALIGAVYQEGIVIAYGGGRNGKSTLFNSLADVLGDYTGSIDIKTLTTDRGNKGASLATLRGKRLVIAGELEEHQRLSVATLKQVASTDKLTIEEKYKQPETVRPSHTMILFTNHLPRVGSTDSGTWRRLVAVPFNATIPAGSGVQNYGDVLVKESGGAILAWAIEGAVNFVRNGFKLDVPESVEEATEAYRQREDWLSNFIAERCVKDPNARVGAAELYYEYRNWAESTGDYTRRLNDFTAAMETAGYKNVRPKNKSAWIGLKIDLAAKFGNPCAASV